jgi:hypothetical protein
MKKMNAKRQEKRSSEKTEGFETYANPITIKQGWPCKITSSKGKKIPGIVRNIKVDKNGAWQMDIHREIDNTFIMTMRWEE